MAAPNMNGRLHITDVHQKPPASFRKGKLQIYGKQQLLYYFMATRTF